MKKQPLGLGAVQYGRSFLGTPYVWGGVNPRGFDCSGYVGYIYRNMGVNLPRTSAQQWAYLRDRGKSISQNQLQPGDLIFYGKGGVSHVMMYAGNGQVIGASGGKKMGGSVKMKRLGYRSDVIGYAAVSRNVNATMPGAVPKQTKDPNAKGTNNVWKQAIKRQMIMSSLLKPNANTWKRTPIVGEQSLENESYVDVEQGVI